MSGSKRPKIGLALGSGGAKGLAHIGIIKALERGGIPIDCIAGSSIGALIGGFYAAGLDIKEIESIALNTNWRTMFSMVDPRLKQGLIGGKKVDFFIQSHIGKKKFEDCRIPFAAIATDLRTGERIVFTEGEMAPAIRASISIPMVFKPVEMGKKVLADGGLSNPVPVETVRNMGSDVVIAINLDKHYYKEEWKSGFFDIANDSLNILRHHLALLDVMDADLVIDIDVSKSYWYEFINGNDKILAGEGAIKKILPSLRKMMRLKSKKDLKKYLKKLRARSL